MTSNEINALSSGMSAVAAVAALVIALIGLSQSRRAAEATRRQTARQIDDALQSRIEPMYPGLRRVCGHVEDGVPQEIRSVLIPFFVLYSDAFGAQRDGLLDERDWQGFAQELAYWAQKPVAQRAWAAFRNQSWTDGFVDHVDAVLSGSPAYPNLNEVRESAPEVEWIDDRADGPAIGSTASNPGN